MGIWEIPPPKKNGYLSSSPKSWEFGELPKSMGIWEIPKITGNLGNFRYVGILGIPQNHGNLGKYQMSTTSNCEDKDFYLLD